MRTLWNSSPHQGNQNHNGNISKAVPAKFKIHRTITYRIIHLFNRNQRIRTGGLMHGWGLIRGVAQVLRKMWAYLGVYIG